MAAMDRKRTYIREWRDKRGYTLDAMVGRLKELDVETTGATLSRVERGKVPYGQDLMEALAKALDVEVWQLTRDDPTKEEAVVIDFLSHLDSRELKQAEGVLRAMFPNRA